MSGSHRNSQKLNFVSVLVEPGRETGIFYIPVANLARGTTWRELRAFVEKGAQCVVDRVEVYPPDSGYVRVADEASFDRVFYFLNGGVLKERGLIAFDGNRTEKVAVKVQEDDPQFASIVSSPKSPSAMGTPIQGGLPLVSYPEPFPGSPQAGVSYPGVAAGSNPGLQYTTTSSYQGYGTGSPLQYHTSPQLASPGLPSLGVSSPASYQYTYSPTEQYSQVYPMYTGVAGTAVAQCPGAEFGYGLYDSYSQQAQPWPGQVTAVEAAGYGNTALGGGQFGDPDKRAIMIKNMSFDGLNDAKIRGYIYNHVSQDAGNKVQSVEIPAQRSGGGGGGGSKPRGYAIVWFATADVAEAATRALHNAKVDGRKLEVRQIGAESVPVAMEYYQDQGGSQAAAVDQKKERRKQQRRDQNEPKGKDSSRGQRPPSPPPPPPSSSSSASATSSGKPAIAHGTNLASVSRGSKKSRA